MRNKHRQKAIGQAVDYFQTEAGIAEYEDDVQNGKIGTITQVYQKVKSDVDFLDFSQLINKQI